MVTDTKPLLISFVLLAAAMMLVSCGGGGGGGTGVAPTPPPIPSAPSSVYALASNQTVTIRWNSMSFATSYTVLRSSTSPTTGYLVKASGLQSTLYTDTTVSNNATYYYVVQSMGASGASGFSAPATATPLASPGTTLSGTIQYEDKEYDIFGFTGKTMIKAVRYARVDLVNSASGTSLNSTITSSAGTFSFNVSGFTGTGVYISVESDAVSPAGEVVVKDMSKRLYSVRSADLTVVANTAADLGFSIPTSNAAGGAFNIIDVYTSSAQFVSSMSSTSVPTLSVYWPNTDTYYCSPVDFAGNVIGCGNGEGIYVLSDPPVSPAYDTDEYDDDVLWHEYGHFIAYHFSKDDSPGGAHAFWINDYDLRLTWSEGWADFFETAVKNWLFSSNPSLLSTAPLTPLSQYVDTATTPGYYYNSITIATPEVQTTGTGCNPGECIYSSNEIAVANVLWTLLAGNGLNGNYGMGPIWTAVSDPLFTATTPRVNIESLYDTMVSKNTSSATDIQTILSSRSIDYSEDQYELLSDGSALNTQNVYAGMQSHTLYTNASATHYDEDFVQISAAAATNYTVTISNLRNGAAPYVQILGADGATQITSNDPSASFDPNSPNYCDSFGCHVNGTGTLASQTTPFNVPGGSRAFVRVKTSDNVPVSAGRYGSYTVTITP